MRTQGATRKTTTVASIQFGSDNLPMIDSTDGRLLNQLTQNPSAMSDSAKASIGIQTRVGTFSSYNTGAPGSATQRSPTTSVQLQARTGLVTVAGHQVTEEVAATLVETAPQLFVPEEERAAEAAAVAKAEADAEAERASDNKFADPATEAAHLHFVSELPIDQKIGALVSVYRDGTLSESQIQNLASGMHVSPDEFVSKWNDMANHLQAQVSAVARGKGIDLEQFSGWMRDVRGQEAVKALTRHALDRDVVGAYGKHMDDFLARGNKR